MRWAIDSWSTSRIALALALASAVGCVPRPDDDATVPAPSEATAAPAAPVAVAPSAVAVAPTPEAIDAPDVPDASGDEPGASADPDDLVDPDDPDGDVPLDDGGDDDGEATDEESIVGEIAAADIPLDPGDATSIDTLVPPLHPRPWVRHRRVPRETLAQIAYRYGATIDEVREWNGFSPDTVALKRGARVRVKARRRPPPRVSVDYEIAEGDTWASIAAAHGVDERDVRSYNWPYRGKMRPGNHLVLWVDPIVRDWIREGGDPTTVAAAGGVPRGAIGIGSPDEGRLLNGVRIPASRAYNLRLPKSAYGTTHAVTELVRGFARFEADSAYDRPFEIGAMSRPTGGEIGTHRSHQTGRDVDIRLPRRAGVSSYRPLTPRRVDWRATWELVAALAEVDVLVVFLDYDLQKRLHRAAKDAGASDARIRELLQFPRGRAAMRGLVRHSEGHVRHIHVRFGCGAYETECMP